MSAATGVLTLRELQVAFGGLFALDDVSIEFDAGEITGLIGPNGSGKSTLVNAVSGQIRRAAAAFGLVASTSRPCARTALCAAASLAPTKFPGCHRN